MFLLAAGDIPVAHGNCRPGPAGRQAVGNLVRAREMALYGGAVPGDLLDLILIALAAAFAVAVTGRASSSAH